MQSIFLQAKGRGQSRLLAAISHLDSSALNLLYYVWWQTPRRQLFAEGELEGNPWRQTWDLGKASAGNQYWPM